MTNNGARRAWACLAFALLLAAGSRVAVAIVALAGCAAPGVAGAASA